MKNVIIKTKTLKRTGTSLNIIINELILPNCTATRFHICRGGVHMKNSSADYHPLESTNCLQLNLLIEPQQSYGYFHKIIVLMNIIMPAGYKNNSQCQQDPLEASIKFFALQDHIRLEDLRWSHLEMWLFLKWAPAFTLRHFLFQSHDYHLLATPGSWGLNKLRSTVKFVKVALSI